MTRAVAVTNVVCPVADESGRAKSTSKDVASLNSRQLNFKAFGSEE
jgi:hypothetical protein